jgi:hypothetical protein
VYGEAAPVRVGEIRVLVEHGDIYDPWNRIDHDGLRRAVMRLSRGLDAEGLYAPPPGSKLIVERLSELRHRYPWVDLLKPERPAVVPLLYAFSDARQKFKLRGVIRELCQAGTRTLVGEVRRAVRPESLYRAAGQVEDRRMRFLDWAGALDDETARGILSRDQEGEQLDKLIPTLRRVATEDHYFDISAHDDAASAAAFLLRQGADVVVNGHTHAVKAYELKEAGGLYFNAGTWALLMRLPDSDSSDEHWRHFLGGLAEGRADGFLRPNFVRVTEDAVGVGVSASLYDWREQAPSPRAGWRSPAERGTWQQEM